MSTLHKYRYEAHIYATLTIWAMPLPLRARGAKPLKNNWLKLHNFYMYKINYIERLKLCACY